MVLQKPVVEVFIPIFYKKYFTNQLFLQYTLSPKFRLTPNNEITFQEDNLVIENNLNVLSSIESFIPLSNEVETDQNQWVNNKFGVDQTIAFGWQISPRLSTSLGYKLALNQSTFKKADAQDPTIGIYGNTNTIIKGNALNPYFSPRHQLQLSIRYNLGKF